MREHFTEALTAQDNIAKKLTEGVPKLLSKDITKDQAQELWDKLSELIDDAKKFWN
jgi:hypothetical protein